MSSSGMNITGCSVGLGVIVGESVGGMTGASVDGGPSVGDWKKTEVITRNLCDRTNEISEEIAWERRTCVGPVGLFVGDDVGFTVGLTDGAFVISAALQLVPP
jgi:hypothetical protein